MKKKSQPTITVSESPQEIIKNVRIKEVSIKVSWEPSCCQLVGIYFHDTDGTLTRHYEGYPDWPPCFTIPYFKGMSRHTGRIHTSLVALAWILDSGMYLKAEGELVRVKVVGTNIKAIGNILLDRWLSEEEGLKDIPYPYCINRSEYE